MARRAVSGGTKPTAAARHQRKDERALRAEQRRLAEREQVSGEINAPTSVTRRRTQRVNGQVTGAPSQPAGTGSAIGNSPTPVSSRALVPERTFSARLIILGLVVLVVISFIVPTVNSFMQQRAEISQVQADIAEEQQRQQELYLELNRWEDPQYLTQQARERLNLVMPGERRFYVIDGVEDSEELAAEQDTEEDPGWAENLWESVVESAAE